MTLQPIERSLSDVRVLVIEDDEDTRELLELLFTDFGADVSTADSAEAAEDLVRATPPDVIVSDLELGGRNGYDLLRTLVAPSSSHGHRIRSVAVTGHACEVERRRALAAGFDEYLAKPFDPRVLVEAVRDLAAQSPRNGS
jgi:CheY-like chemotaxis protein